MCALCTSVALHRLDYSDRYHVSAPSYTVVTQCMINQYHASYMLHRVIDIMYTVHLATRDVRMRYLKTSRVKC